LLARDYASNYYFIASLESASSKRQPGSLYVGSSLINDGYKPFLPRALAAAREIAATSIPNPTDADVAIRKLAKFLLRQYYG
jgi:hypothetical protein